MRPSADEILATELLKPSNFHGNLLTTTDMKKVATNTTNSLADSQEMKEQLESLAQLSAEMLQGSIGVEPKSHINETNELTGALPLKIEQVINYRNGQTPN